MAIAIAIGKVRLKIEGWRFEVAIEEAKLKVGTGEG
jgi:hypothetical protein